MRTVRYFLSSFQVLVPIEKDLSREELYQTRQVVSQTFQEAQAEYVRDATVLNSPVRPHVFVSQIRRGSLDLQVIYQALIELPWHEIVHGAREIAEQGLTIVEHIGSVAAGLETLRRIGPWIKSRLGSTTELVDRDSGPPVMIIQESSLRADPHAFSNSTNARELTRELLHDSTPRATLVLLDAEAVTVIRRVLDVPIDERRHHLGGQVIVHDMNLIMNGLLTLDQLHEGDPFCLHNPAAIGLQINRDEDSLFDACAWPDSNIRIDDIEIDHIEFPERVEIVEGRSIDIEDLPG